MATKRGPYTRRRRQKQQKRTRKYRRTPAGNNKRTGTGLAIGVPKLENNLVYSNSNGSLYSPVSTPGKNTNNTPNSPITLKAKRLASMYPNRSTMIERSISFNSLNKEPMNNWWKRMENEFGTENEPFYRD